MQGNGEGNVPDFTIIEGGGEPRDWEREISQGHFEDFVVDVLRSLVNGELSHRTTRHFSQFLEHAQGSPVPIGSIIDGAVRRLHAMALDAEGMEDYERELIGITQAALRVVAESMAKDNAAAGRLSKREEGLDRAIEQKILGSETRARENGWSYVRNLTEGLGKWPTHKK